VPTPPPQGPDNVDLANAMMGCLQSKLPYYRAMYAGPVAASVPPGQSVEMSAFAIATTLAANAVDQHDRLYGYSSSPTAAAREVVGYLDHCAMDAGLVPTPFNNSPSDPRILYGQFLGGQSSMSPAVEDFSRGFTGWPLTPLPLLQR